MNSTGSSPKSLQHFLSTSQAVSHHFNHVIEAWHLMTLLTADFCRENKSEVDVIPDPSSQWQGSGKPDYNYFLLPLSSPFPSTVAIYNVKTLHVSIILPCKIFSIHSCTSCSYKKPEIPPYHLSYSYGSYSTGHSNRDKQEGTQTEDTHTIHLFLGRVCPITWQIPKNTLVHQVS